MFQESINTYSAASGHVLVIDLDLNISPIELYGDISNLCSSAWRKEAL